MINLIEEAAAAVFILALLCGAGWHWLGSGADRQAVVAMEVARGE